ETERLRVDWRESPMRSCMVALLASAGLLLGANPGSAGEKGYKTRVLRVGAVAYGPSSVTVWRGIKHYLHKKGMPIDFVLYSHYDALVRALKDGHVELAWNTPLAHAKYHLLSGGKS